MLKFYFLLLFGFIFSCHSIYNKPRDSELAGSYYQVKKGDKLALIAQKHRVSIEELAEINGIENYKYLRVGQSLYIPDPDPIGTTIAQHKKYRTNKKLKSHKKTKKLYKKPEPKKFTLAFPIKNGKIIKNFSLNKKSPYEGIGIIAPEGTPVQAAQSGRVLFVGDQGTRYGLIIIIEHKTPYITVYTHLSSSLVKAQDRVKAKQIIGNLGNSGAAKTPHLHFQIRVNERPQDPLKYITLPK